MAARSLLILAGVGALVAWSRGARASVPSTLDVLGDASSSLYEDIVSAVTPGLWTLPERADAYRGAIAEAEATYGIPANMLARLLYQESHFRPEIIDGRVRSAVGAIGIAQFMPATAAELGIDPLDAYASIDAAARYLRRLHDQTGDWRSALAAYNWGIGNVERKGLEHAPAETRAYVDSITRDIGYA